MNRTLITLILAAAVSIGCGKSDGDKPGDKGGDQAAKPTGDTDTAKPAKPAEPAGPDFAPWGVDDKAKAWQGSWLVKDNGRIQAWTIAGTSVKTWDGEKEEAFTLEIASPCKAYFKADGGMMFPHNFTVVGGKMRFGAAGYRKGAEVLFCDMSGSVYTLDAAGKCTVWKDDFGKWVKKDGDCGIKTDAEGAEVFFHGDPNRGEWKIEGDAIVPNASFPTESIEGDFAAAKAARDAKAEAK